MKNIYFAAVISLISHQAFTQLKVWPSGKIYIGGITTTPNSLFSVGAAGNTLYQGYFYNSSTSNGAAAIVGEIAAPTGVNNGYTIMGSVTCGAGYAYGIRGSSYNSAAQNNGQAFGVYGQAGNATNGLNYGVWGRLLGSNNGAGIFGSTGGGASIPAKYAAYFDGPIRTTNDSPLKPNGGAWIGASDLRVKRDVLDFKDGLNVIRRIRPVNYYYNGIGG